MVTVLLVSHHYPPHIGGLEMVVQMQARGMAENGYRVVVLTSRYGNDRSVDDPRLSIELIRLPCSHFMERLRGVVFPLFSPRLLWETWRQVRRADVVHIHDVFYMSSWVAGVFAVLARKPMLLTQHVALVEHSSRLVMAVQRLVYASIGQWLFSRALRVVVYNRNVRDFLLSRDLPEDRILWLANGVDTLQFQPATTAERMQSRRHFGLAVNKPLVLFVGRLVEKKGYHILLAARDPTYDLVFAGPGPLPDHGSDPGVHWVGPVDQEQAAALYKACDLFVFPAVGEIFTLVMQEAMASALPVVTTDDPAYIGSVAEEALVLCPRRPAALRSAIKGLLADAPRMQALGTLSRQLAVQHFDWRVNINQLIDIYRGVLGARP